MDYPRLIHLDEETETRLKSYLDEELLNHYAERGQWVEDLIAIQKEYDAEPPTEVKQFPFKGAANIIIPLIAIVVESLHAREMTKRFALDDFATIKLAKQYEDASWGLTKWVNYELLENGADMYHFADNALLENFKFGTMVGKSGYEKVEKTAVREQGDQEVEFTITTKQGSTADTVPLANFLMPFTAKNPQESPWVGEEHLINTYQFKQLCDNKFFYDDTWDILKQWVTQTNSRELSSTPYTDEVRREQNQDPAWPKEIGFAEIWLSFNVDGGKRDKEVVVYYHKLSRTIMGVRYNWYEDLRRPYRIGKYFNLENRWAGIGVGKQTANFQREITIQHRQRLDNATIANIRMFKINKLAGYGPGEPLFPGKLWFVDNMDDIESLEAGEVYPSSFNDEMQSLQYAQQRNGINELNLGMPQAGTPGTASSDMARLQEGNKKADYSSKNINKFLTEISRDVISNSVQFGTRRIEIFQNIPDGDLVEAFLKEQSPDIIRSQLVMNLQLVGASDNKLQDRANWTQLSGQLQQYYTGLFEFAMQLKDQQLIQTLAQVIPSGATEAMKQILQSYDGIRDIGRIIPEQLILGYQPDIQNPELLNGPQGNPNGQPNPGTPPNIQAPGMGLPTPSPQQVGGPS